jgi:hypothetical protein
VQEILQHLRDGTTGAIAAGKEAYQKARVVAPPPFPRRRGWFVRLLTSPFRLIGWVFRNLLSVLAVLAILGLCIGAAEIAARAMFG